MLVPFSSGHEDRSPSMELARLLDSCRAELDQVREDIAWNGGDRAAIDLHSRLTRTTDRLQSALGTVQRLERLHAPSPAHDPAAPILVREADHRLRNGLTTVLSLLHRQAEHSEDETVGDALRLFRARIAVVTELHGQLGTLSGVLGEDREVALDAYLHALADAMTATFRLGDGGRSLRTRVAPLIVTPNIAQTIGLIVIELAAHALRHAFPPGQPGGTVSITGERAGPLYRLTVEDDGTVPNVADAGEEDPGLRLIRSLAHELGAEFACHRGPGGTRAILALREAALSA